MTPEFWLALAGFVTAIIFALIKLVHYLLDREVQILRKWKHERADPYIGAMDAMNRRVERIERHLNGHLK